MSRSSVQVPVAAGQREAFTRLRRHLDQTGTLAAAAAFSVDEPRAISYGLRLRGATSQVTTLELTPVGAECLLTLSVDLEHGDTGHADRGWLPAAQLEAQYRVLALSFAHIADGSVEP